MHHHSLRQIVLMSAYVLVCSKVGGQNVSDSLTNISPRYISLVNDKAYHISTKLKAKTAKVLSRFKKQEQKIYSKLARRDSLKATYFLEEQASKYAALERAIQRNGSLRQFIPGLDTMANSLSFLQNYGGLNENSAVTESLRSSMQSVSGLKDQFQEAELVRQFIHQRRSSIERQLKGTSLIKNLKGINKEVFYYSQQIQEYKSLVSDQKKLERKVLETLRESKFFQDFMSKNSHLSSLFRPSGNYSGLDATMVSGQTLQTRTQVLNLLEQQLGSANAQATFRQNLADAQSELSQLKDRLSDLPEGSGTLELPKGYTPNNQRVKGLWERLDVSANFQSHKANGWLPASSDIALNIGYKQSDRFIYGIGLSYRVGWGEGLRKMKITHEGIGIRSFLDWKLKNILWITGGYEMNYRSSFNRIQELSGISNWQRSGLIGLSKNLAMKTRVLKQTKLQLLWDFLSYSQVPATQPIIFRVGYNF